MPQALQLLLEGVERRERLVLRQQLVKLGIQPTFGTPAEFKALMQAELPKWAEIVKRSGATNE